MNYPNISTHASTVGTTLEGAELANPVKPVITADEFKSAFRNHPGGVAVVTADAGNGPVGLTATSVVSVNVEPNILAFSISESSSSTPTILKANTVVVHLLAAEHVNIAKLCATSGIDRFADTSQWGRLESGEPYFPSVHAWIRGRIVNRMDAGGSTILAVEALQASPGMSDDARPGEPLVYHNRSWHALGEASRI